MATTLQQAIASINKLGETGKKRGGNISDELLGKYEGIIPVGKNSTEAVKELRSSLYGKVKD